MEKEPYSPDTRQACCLAGDPSRTPEAPLTRWPAAILDQSPARQPQIRMVGTKGWLRLSPAYDYKQPAVSQVVVAGKMKRKQYRETDQFGAQLIYFSDCILKGKKPEPDGYEGWADVRAINAIFKAAETGRAVKMDPVERQKRISMKQEIHRPPAKKPELVKVAAPTK